MAGNAIIAPIIQKDRMLVVADGGRLVEELRQRYPEWEIITSDSYMAAICLANDAKPRAVVTYVDPANHHLPGAVAGLREAAGNDTRLLLCCPPEAEPLARQALASGADDYILYPIQVDELDRALDIPDVQAGLTIAADAPPVALAELNALADVLSHLDAQPIDFLRRVANMIMVATGAEGVSVAIRGSTASAGAPVVQPVLAEPVDSADGVIGQISLGPRKDHPFSSSDVTKVRHYARMAGDLIQTASKHRHWQTLALTDEITGVPNRRYMLRFLDQVLERAKEERFRVTLLLFDIDNFKIYNDTCGHDAGDEILRLVARLFQHNCRDDDVVTRFGGDEFAVVFWDAEERRVADSRHPEDALKVLSRFTKDLSSAEPEAISESLPSNPLTISGGLATFPWDAQTRDDLIHKADQALIQAKQAGKNRVFTVGNPE